MNVALFLVQIFFKVFPSIWIIFAVILWEGLLGGAAYVNTFYKITIQVGRLKHRFVPNRALFVKSVKLGRSILSYTSILINSG